MPVVFEGWFGLMSQSHYDSISVGGVVGGCSVPQVLCGVS